MWTHGTFYWNELNTHDPERAKAFYGDALGWTFEGMPLPGAGEATYYVIKAPGAEMPAGGIFTMAGPCFDGIPDHWLGYIACDDVDARVAAAAKAGGTLLREPFDVPGIGRIAIVKDATGAVAGWITPVMPT